MIRKTSLCNSSISSFRQSGPEVLVSDAHLEIFTRSFRRNAAKKWMKNTARILSEETYMDYCRKRIVGRSGVRCSRRDPSPPPNPIHPWHGQIWTSGVSLEHRKTQLALAFHVCRHRGHILGRQPPIGDDPASHLGLHTSTTYLSAKDRVR